MFKCHNAKKKKNIPNGLQKRIYFINNVVIFFFQIVGMKCYLDVLSYGSALKSVQCLSIKRNGERVSEKYMRRCCSITAASAHLKNRSSISACRTHFQNEPDKPERERETLAVSPLTHHTHTHTHTHTILSSEFTAARLLQAIRSFNWIFICGHFFLSSISLRPLRNIIRNDN